MHAQAAGGEAAAAEGGDGALRERALREARDALGLLAMAAAVHPGTVAEHLDLLLKARTAACICPLLLDLCLRRSCPHTVRFRFCSR